VKSDTAGAVVTFSGDVRNHDKGKKVSTLNYEIHPSAQSVIEKITSEVVAKHDVVNVAVAHRYGEIPIGESAFVVAVAAAHRGPAFACCNELVERVKAELPIWKYQEFADGSTEWVNSA
jgi:molybdopterin synthase catalytic subunit